MYISSLRKRGKWFYGINIIVVALCLTVVSTVRFIDVATPFVENKARYMAIDIINTQVSNYLNINPGIFSDIINISSDGGISSANINTENLNIIKANLTKLMNEALSQDNPCKVKVPVANLIGVTFLSGIGSPVTITMKPVSRVLIDFENKFVSEGINQTHLLLYLKVKVTVMAIIPGLRRSVSVETDIPVGESVFMGNVPNYYAMGNGLQMAIKGE